jgi:hypothetical protein
MPNECLASAVHPQRSAGMCVRVPVCERARERVCVVFEPRKDEKREESCEVG